MSITAIEPGDVVMLKSGGAMTVEDLVAPPPNLAGATHGFSAGNMARCVWLDANGVAQERLFWTHLLILDPKASSAKSAALQADEKRATELAKDADARAAAAEAQQQASIKAQLTAEQKPPAWPRN